MNWVQFTRIDGQAWQIASNNICGASEGSVKGEAIVTLMLVGGGTIQVKGETLESVRRKVGAAIGRPVSVITEA